MEKYDTLLHSVPRRNIDFRFKISKRGIGDVRFEIGDLKLEI
jgi:hypothetical protein